MKSLNRFLSASHSCLTSSSRRRGSVRLVSALTTALAFGLSACGDDITEINANVGAIKSTDDLPACTEDIAGQTAFVKETHEFLGCDGKEWMVLGANTVSVGDNVCTSTSLNDGTGFEIFCNGESIGTVKNGKDGAKGEKGDDGAPGAKGDKGTDGTNGTNGTGCIIKESSTLTATIACGSETFTMDLTGYVEQPEVCDANVSAEDCATLDSAISLSGVSQKGPFVTGTDITAYELQNGRSLKQTGKTFGGKIERADGTFDIKTVKLNSAFAYIVADGFYRNEVTGENSSAAIKLRALTNLKGRSSANINLVTHLEYDRVQYLVTRKDSSVTKAKMAAEKELFTAFGINNSGFEGLAEDLNVLKEGKGNAALLAISVLLQGDRNESELTALLAALSVDLGDNGQWDNAKQRAQIADWAMKTDLNGGLPKIRANVEGWKLAESAAPAFEPHVTNFWMQELGVDKCSSVNAGALFAVKNKNSAYYAANDSAYTDGDSSLVRLICAASGDSFAWRFATDLEKDVAALAKDLPADTAVAGKINTDFVYVKDSVWRRGTVLDTALRASCVAANRGMTDSLMVRHEPVWYICDVGDDASVPFAWREATTAEADTAGFGTPNRDTARVGNVNKSLVYVFEDTSETEVGKWRYGTELDVVKDLGPCTKNNLDTVKSVSVGETKAWYTCASDKLVLVNNEQLPYAWREATDIEKDVTKLPKTADEGTVRRGPLNPNLYYVYQDGWRYGTALDSLLEKACITNGDYSTPAKYNDLYYVCTEQVASDTIRRWIPASDLYNDTHEAENECNNLGKHGFGSILNGRVNTYKKYVCDKGVFRQATVAEIDDGRACVENIYNFIYKLNGKMQKCTEDDGWIPVADGDSSGRMKDASGRQYGTVLIAGKLWMKENLNYETDESYCFDDSESKCDKYGRLYTWSAAMKACPIGWHLPTLQEVNELIAWAEYGYGWYQNSSGEWSNESCEGKAGYRLKAKYGWPSGNGFDVFNFTLFPAGVRSEEGTYHTTCAGFLWTSTERREDSAYTMEVSCNDDDVNVVDNMKVTSYSVRCVQD